MLNQCEDHKITIICHRLIKALKQEINVCDAILVLKQEINRFLNLRFELAEIEEKCMYCYSHTF